MLATPAGYAALKGIKEIGESRFKYNSQWQCSIIWAVQVINVLKSEVETTEVWSVKCTRFACEALVVPSCTFNSKACLQAAMWSSNFMVGEKIMYCTSVLHVPITQKNKYFVQFKTWVICRFPIVMCDTVLFLFFLKAYDWMFCVSVPLILCSAYAVEWLLYSEDFSPLSNQ